MSDRYPQFPQFEDLALPCEGCGELIAVASTYPERTSELWGKDKLVAWCRDCWAAKFGVPSDE